MVLFIAVSPKQTTFTLRDKNQLRREHSFTHDSNLSNLFLPALDRFLNKHKIKVKELKGIKLKVDPKLGLTTSRVVQATVKALNWTNSL